MFQYQQYITTFNNVLSNINWEPVDKFVELLINRDKSSTVYTCGTGGGQNIAQHFSEDLISYLLNKNVNPIKSICLGSNPGLASAISNDIGFNNVFLKEFEILSSQKDILCCFTGSGNSPCLLSIADYANQQNITTVVFTGQLKGSIEKMADILIHIPSMYYTNIHPLQSFIFHVILDEYIKRYSLRNKQ